MRWDAMGWYSSQVKIISEGLNGQFTKNLQRVGKVPPFKHVLSRPGFKDSHSLGLVLIAHRAEP